MLSRSPPLAATTHLLTSKVRNRVRVRGVPSHSPPLAATTHLLTSEVRNRVRVRGVPSHSPLLAATTHLLTSEVRNRVKSERCAVSLAAASGYHSPADM